MLDGATVKALFVGATVKALFSGDRVDFMLDGATVKTLFGGATIPVILDGATVEALFGGATVKGLFSGIAICSDLIIINLICDHMADRLIVLELITHRSTPTGSKPVTYQICVCCWGIGTTSRFLGHFYTGRQL